MKELDNTFSEISCVIDESRANAYRKINEELILMYREIGRFYLKNQKMQHMAILMLTPLQSIYSHSFPV